MKKIIIALCLCGMLTLTSGCQQKKVADDAFRITTTFYPMYYFTKEIVKNKATVTMLTPSNMEPHDYEPSAKAMASIEDSRLFIYNSDDMETWVPDIKQTLQTDSHVHIVEASKHIPPLYRKDNAKKSADPHVWLDPVLAKKEVQTITNAVIQQDPKHKAFYQKNSEHLQQNLERLNQKFIAATKHAKQKTFVTQHAAFSYLAQQYGLHQEAIAGIDPEQEPTPKELSQIEDYVKKAHIRYIYVEEKASNKVAKTVKEATGATLLTLTTLESVSQEAQRHGATYFTLMEQNLKALEKTLND